MKRIRSNKHQRYVACGDLTRTYQCVRVGQRDLFGNDVGPANDTLRVSYLMGGFGFKWVKEDLAISYCDESNEVTDVNDNGNSLPYQSPRFNELADRVYKLVDDQITINKRASV